VPLMRSTPPRSPVATVDRREADPHPTLRDVLRAMQVGHDDADARASDATRDDFGGKMFAGWDALDRNERREAGCEHECDPRPQSVR
jgi:hypothetical protein